MGVWRKEIFGGGAFSWMRCRKQGEALACLVAILPALSCFCAEALAGSAGSGVAIRERAAFPVRGEKMRFVWIQDLEESSTGASGGTKFRLMGLDSGDERGEREIVGTLANYAKPLIAPRGDRVVFSDRVRKKVYVVNFDGSALRELATGFGMAVWRDRRTGREWVYYGMEENKEEHCPVVYRKPIDGGTAQLVWNKTLVSVDGFQVSQDGRRASGNFPWPGGGIAHLPNGSLRILARGCWPGLAPDGPPLFWIFDDAHRNLTLMDTRRNRRWQVRIDAASGIDGYEVYHPKWGNRSRFLVMTGPYNVGTGTNRIAAGGKDVEVFLGRFNAEYTKIESWMQVTRNGWGDFFPDVWIDPSIAQRKVGQAFP